VTEKTTGPAEVIPVRPGTTRVRLDPEERCTAARATTQHGAVVAFELPELGA
jgi:hypothetical protein